MDRLKHTLKAAIAIALGAAIVFIALAFIGGVLAIAGIVIAMLILVGGIWALFAKKPLTRGTAPLTVVFTRLDETDAERDQRRR